MAVQTLNNLVMTQDYEDVSFVQNGTLTGDEVIVIFENTDEPASVIALIEKAQTIITEYYQKNFV